LRIADCRLQRSATEAQRHREGERKERRDLYG
jgi:hypothetical protein